LLSLVEQAMGKQSIVTAEAPSGDQANVDDEGIDV